MSMEAIGAIFDEHKTRKGGGGMDLTYISIDQMLNRANDVWGMDWSCELLTFELKDDVCYIAVSITHHGGTTRIGVGASTMKDPDDRVKSALAEAIKKALNLYGMGLYLWDDEQREEATKQALTLDQKKKLLVQYWQRNHPGEEPTKAALTSYYDTDQFDDEGVVDELLADNDLD